MEGNASSLANRPTLLKLASYSTALLQLYEHRASRILTQVIEVPT